MATTNSTTCSVEHCSGPTHTRGYCQPHYNRKHRTGDPLSVSEKIELGLIAEPERRCSVEGCTRDKRVKGMCNRHYGNLSNYGHAVPRREWSVNDTLDYTGWDVTASGCWEWRGARNDLGYGTLTLVRQGLDKARVHRLMYERYNGLIPEGLIVRHKCDNPPCSNPDHLELGTMADNTQDMMERGRHWRHGAEECLNGHPITDPSTYRFQERSDRNGEKVCLRCQRERHVRWHEKKKLERAKLREAS